MVPVGCVALAFLGMLGGKKVGVVAFFVAFAVYGAWAAALLLKGGRERWKTANLFFLCLFIVFPAALVAVRAELCSWESLEDALRSWVGIVVLASMVIVGVIQEVRNKRAGG